MFRLSNINLVKNVSWKLQHFSVNYTTNTSSNHEAKLKKVNDEPASSPVRINDIGIQMISDRLRRYLFDTQLPSQSDKVPENENTACVSKDQKEEQLDLLKKVKDHLHKFDLATKPLGEKDILKDVNELDLPKLEGKNIEEHIYNISSRQIEDYLKLMSVFSSNKLPKIPDSFSFTAGWTRYDAVTGVQTKVEYPDDEALVFDIESLVRFQNCPVMATAVSSKAWYSWCSERLVDNNFIGLTSLELADLIPFESSDEQKRKSTKRIVIGHNVGFDRSFIREQYKIERSGLRFMDTMSMHIACSGFSHDQRNIILSDDNNEIPDSILKVNDFRRKFRPSYKWKHMGCLNNLRDVHNFYCPLASTIKKDSRDLFVKGTPDDIRGNFQMLMNYCANDSRATYEVFRELIVVFLSRFPHPATMAGMLEMSTMYLPINQNWFKYINNCERKYQDSEIILKKLLEKSANEACQYIDQKVNDPWLVNLDWTTKEFKLTKKATETRLKNDLNKSDFLKIITNEDTFGNDNAFYKISSDRFKNKIENINNALDISDNFKKILATSKFLPKNLPNLCNYPNWYRELCPKFLEENWTPGPTLITTKTRVTPYVLRLTWNNNPIFHHKDHGWGYLLSREEYEKHQGSQETAAGSEKADKKKKKPKTPVIINGKYFVKIPHKDGDKLNVGNPLAKSFLAKINEGVLSSIPKRNAYLALKYHTIISYWENNRDRIMAQKAILSDTSSNTGAILPITVAAGTITRRAVEPTWLTASNYSKDRIGTELKPMIQPPDGYHFVGADVDSQELWIAATIGDSNFAKMHGSTALGWMNLQGKKSDGTDMHSKTASIIGISRDQAKVFNYGRIYGAGVTFAVKLLMQFNPQMSEEEAKKKARELYASTKGKKLKQNKDDTNNAQKQSAQDRDPFELSEFNSDETAKWADGTESEMFNKLEDIAKSKYPKTPVLGASITRTLEPENVNQEFITSRINWVVQSSAVDYLHIMLVCMNWLIEKYNIDARFSISIHDEVRYLVKENDKFRAALALQLTNLFTRAMFSYKLGFDDLPMSVAFFSGVDIDKCLRKEPDLDFVSPSNPSGLGKGYSIPKGTCLNIYDIIQQTKGILSQK